MNTNVASNLLVQKFGEFGMTVKQRYNYVRYWLSRKFDTVEKFSIEDIMCMTGLSRVEVEKKLEDLAENLSEEEYVKYFIM